MKKRITVFVLVIAVGCAAAFSACVDNTLNEADQLEVLNNELDRLIRENDGLKSDNHALKDDNEALNLELEKLKQKPALPLNAVLYEESDAWSVLVNAMFPEFDTYYQDHAFVIKTKAQFDELFTEEKKVSAYATINDYYKENYETIPEWVNNCDFDIDFPFGATEFSEKTLVVYFFVDSNTGIQYEIKSIIDKRFFLHPYKFGIILSNANPIQESMPLSCLRCLVVELDKVDTDDRYYFDEVEFWWA